MRPFRLLLSLTTCVLAITFLLYVSVTEPSDPATDHPDSEDRRTGLGALFSFHGPLFPPSAIISLTDDNSTFFLARPAAFGPLLPSRGLSGQLWIGSGFASDGLGSSTEGELGCSDVPGWDEGFGVANGSEQPDEITDGSYDRRGRGRPRQESADVSGNIVLLSRGGCGFLEKVKWAQRRGGVAVIVGDNIRGGPIITMYARGDTSNITIPALFTSRTTAHLLSTLVPMGGMLGTLSPEMVATLATKATSSEKMTEKMLFAHKIEPPWDPDSPPTTIPPTEATAKRKKSRGPLFNFLASLFGYSSESEEEVFTRRLRSRSKSGGRDSQLSTFDDWRANHNGLWVTLTPTNMSSNPFLDTLLVLVVSPLVTLTVVYALLLLRSRMQRRRWRAPKSVVERLPVRTYHTLPSSSSQLATPIASTPTTPLLQSEHRTQLRSPARYDTLDIPSSSGSRHHRSSVSSDHEKRESGLAEWRRRYGGRQRECVVCLEEYVDGVSRVMSLPCGHEFHAECITPWLTTRRRTCPICKGDVVRSLARHTTRSASPSPSPSTRRRLRRDVDDEDDSEASLSDEDVQVQAAIRRNDSPSAAMPIPTAPEVMRRDELYEDDLERGTESAPEVRPRTEGSTIWRTVGSWGLPGLGSFGRADNQRDRDR